MLHNLRFLSGSKFWISLFVLILSLLLFCPDRILFPEAAATPLSADSLSEKIVRFHILADGNDTVSQEIKLHVRDEVLAFVTNELQKSSKYEPCRNYVTGKGPCNSFQNTAEAESVTFQDAAEAEAALNELLPLIQAKTDEVLSSLGVGYTSSVRLTTRYFPIKQYGSLLLPPGDYRALEITLGSGTGKNWWCMLYPSLCFTEGITGTLPEEEQEELRGLLTKEEFDLLFCKKKKPVFRLKLVKLWKELFNCGF